MQRRLISRIHVSHGSLLDNMRSSRRKKPHQRTDPPLNHRMMSHRLCPRYRKMTTHIRAAQMLCNNLNSAGQAVKATRLRGCFLISGTYLANLASVLARFGNIRQIRPYYVIWQIYPFGQIGQIPTVARLARFKSGQSGQSGQCFCQTGQIGRLEQN